MYSLLLLGIVPGTNIQITFTLWCEMFGMIVALGLILWRNARFRGAPAYLSNLVSFKFAPNLIHQVAGHQRFTVQFEIFEQKLTAFIRMYSNQLFKTPKVKR